VLNGVDVGRDLHRITHRGGGRYKPLLEHVARRKGRRLREQNSRLKRLLAEAELEKDALREVAKGKF
jgi:hypothetical protein